MKWHPLVVVATFGSALLSQATGTVPVTHPESRVDQRASSMREQIGSGKPVQSHVRVAVRLKNGNKLLGVVKDGRMVERVDGLRFVDANAQERGAGVRLWYTGGTRNYVFVPFADFSEYEVLQQLSAKQIEQIETEMQMNERRAAERAAEAARAAKGDADAAPPVGEPAPTPTPTAAPGDAAKPAKPGKAGKEKESEGTEAAKAEAEAQKVAFALVKDFPPEGGWNLAKRDEIKRRMVVVGAKPTEAEQRFVDSFDAWLKACAKFGIDPSPKVEEAGEPAPTDRKSRRGR